MFRIYLGGSWDLVSKVISTSIGVISIVTLIITLVTKSHDPLSRFRVHGSFSFDPSCLLAVGSKVQGLG